MATPQPLTGLKNIAPYVAGESELTGFDRVIKLASNEGAFGPSKKVLEALTYSSHDFYRYPDGDCTELRELLANKNSLPKDNIICGVLAEMVHGFFNIPYIVISAAIIGSLWGCAENYNKIIRVKAIFQK